MFFIANSGDLHFKLRLKFKSSFSGIQAIVCGEEGRSEPFVWQEGAQLPQTRDLGSDYTLITNTDCPS